MRAHLLRPVLAALVVVVLSWRTAATGQEAKKVHVILCSAEPVETRNAFSEAMAAYLTFAKLDVRLDCPKPPTDASPDHLVARFASMSDGRAELQITDSNGATRTRGLEWIGSGPPLGETLERTEVAKLALVLETLLLEFESVQLLDAPPLPSQTGEDDSQPAAPDSASPARESAPTDTKPDVPEQSTPVRARMPAAPRRERPRNAECFVAEVGGGAILLPSTVSAPAFFVSSAYETHRWGTALMFRQTVDSNFAIDGRPFATSVSAFALGAQLALWRRDQVRLGAGGYAVGMLSRYRRSDLGSQANTRQWADLGVGVNGVGRLRLATGVLVNVSAGVEVVPTARVAEIQDGPRRTTGIVKVPILAGVGLLF